MVPLFPTVGAWLLVKIYYALVLGSQEWRLGWQQWYWSTQLGNVLHKTYVFLCYKWYFDVLRNKIIVIPLSHTSYRMTFYYVERGFLELFGVYGLTYLVSMGGGFVRRFHLSKVYQGFIIPNFGYFLLFGLVFGMPWVSWNLVFLVGLASPAGVVQYCVYDQFGPGRSPAGRVGGAVPDGMGK
jgi:hypothetical protein